MQNRHEIKELFFKVIFQLFLPHFFHNGFHFAEISSTGFKSGGGGGGGGGGQI